MVNVFIFSRSHAQCGNERMPQTSDKRTENSPNHPGSVFGGLGLTPNPPYDLFGRKGNEE